MKVIFSQILLLASKCSSRYPTLCSILALLIRLLFLPLLIIADLVLAPSRCIDRQLQRGFESQYKPHRIQCYIPYRATYLAQQILQANFHDECDQYWVWDQIKNSLNQSWGIIYEITVYNVIVRICVLLRLDPLFNTINLYLEHLLSTLFTGFYITSNGNLFPFSLVNVMSPSFDVTNDNVMRLKTLGKHAAQTPFHAYFLAVMSKLAYEYPEVIEDVICTKWKLNFEAFITTNDLTHSTHTKSKTLDSHPNTSVFVASNEFAVFVIFRGTALFDLVNWRYDIAFRRVKMPNNHGTVHGGIFNALFYSFNDITIVDRINTIIHQQHHSHKALYVSGHSLGAALASLFAATYNGPLSIEGVYSYGQPRVGDDDYVKMFNQRFQTRCFRFVHTVDIVAKAPFGYGYRHHALEGYITVNGKVIDDTHAIFRARIQQGFGNVLTYPIINAIMAPFRREPLLRCIGRVMLLPFPGIAAHSVPSYEDALRTRI